MIKTARTGLPTTSILDTAQKRSVTPMLGPKKFIPKDALKRVLACKSTSDVREMAQDLRISPAVIAGRLRFEQKNWKLFSRLIGQEEPSRTLGLYAP